MQHLLTDDLKKLQISATWPPFEKAGANKHAVTPEIYIMKRKVLSTVAIDNHMYGRRASVRLLFMEVQYWTQMWNRPESVCQIQHSAWHWKQQRARILFTRRHVELQHIRDVEKHMALKKKTTLLLFKADISFMTLNKVKSTLYQREFNQNKLYITDPRFT